MIWKWMHVVAIRRSRNFNFFPLLFDYSFLPICLFLSFYFFLSYFLEIVLFRFRFCFFVFISTKNLHLLFPWLNVKWYGTTNNVWLWYAVLFWSKLIKHEFLHIPYQPLLPLSHFAQFSLFYFEFLFYLFFFFFRQLKFIFGFFFFAQRAIVADVDLITTSYLKDEKKEYKHMLIFSSWLEKKNC